MPTLQKYTQQIQGGVPNSPRASAASFGGETAGLQAQAQSAQNSADILGESADRVNKVIEKRNNRLDTINRVRATEQFYNDAFTEYNRIQSEGDLIDPSTASGFNESLRKKASEVLANFTGSDDARAQLEAELIGHSGSFGRQMTQSSLAAQRKFLMKTAGDKINALALQARENPASINEILNQADFIVKDMSSALYPEDEIALQNAAREQVSMSTLYSFVDRGEYEEVNALIDENPALLEFISPERQREILGQIDTGLKEQQKIFDEANKRRDLLAWGEKQTGQKVDPTAALNFVLGGDFKKPDEQVVAEIADIYKIPVDEVPPEVIMKVKYPDLKLFDDVNHNDEFGPGGKLTTGGIKKNMAPVVRDLESFRLQKNMLDTAIEAGKNGNLAATQAAVVKFKKILDPTSSVMEGEVRMQEEAEGLAGRIDLMFKPGKAISDEQLDELQALTDKFQSDMMKVGKKKVDNYLTDADSRGFRRIDIGMPRDVYKDIFGTDVVGSNEEEPAPDGLSDISDDELKRMLAEMPK